MTSTSSWTAETFMVKGRFDGLAHGEVDAVAHQGGEAREAHRDPVGTEGQQQAAEAAVAVGRDLPLEVGGGVLDGDGGAGDGGAALVDDGSFDDARGGLRLGESGSGGGPSRAQHASAGRTRRRSVSIGPPATAPEGEGRAMVKGGGRSLYQPPGVDGSRRWAPSRLTRSWHQHPSATAAASGPPDLVGRSGEARDLHARPARPATFSWTASSTFARPR